MFFPAISYAQVSSGGLPRGEPGSLTDIKAVELSLPVELLSKQVAAGEIELAGKNRPYIYASSIAVDINPFNSGRLTQLKGGGLLWEAVIESKGASSLSLLFDSFELSGSARLFIYSPGREFILGAFSRENNKESGLLAVQPVPGDKVIVECYFPDGAINRSKLNIGQVGHGIRDIFGTDELKDGRYGTSGYCNVNINCDEGADWQKEKRSVVRLYIYYADHQPGPAWGFCSGVLVNNAREDRIPYLISACHCIDNQDQANSAVSVFNYESPYCVGLIDGYVSQSVSGADLLAVNENIDFSLVSLSRLPPMNYRPYYAGWDISGNTPGSTVSIHHPQGDIKKISVDNDPPETGTLTGYDYDNNVFWRILRWDMGTTEEGSSGAPLFDQDHLLVGSLVGGEANCSNSVNDYFQKLSESWTNYPAADEQLKAWLDPDASGISSISGFDPYDTVSCDTNGNISAGEQLILKEFTEGVPGDGLWTGHNSIRLSKYAEKIYNSGEKNLICLYYKTGDVEYNSGADSVVFKVWTGETEPLDEIAGKKVYLSSFKDSSDYTLYFDTIISVSGNFWTGYEISYDNAAPGPLTDMFSLMQSEPRGSTGLNTAMFYTDRWYGFDDHTEGETMNISLAISADLCGGMPVLGIEDTQEKKPVAALKIFPNPGRGNIQIDIPFEYSSYLEAEIVNISGGLVYKRKFYGQNERLSIDVSYLPAGFYILKIRSDSFVLSGKISLTD